MGVVIQSIDLYITVILLCAKLSCIIWNAVARVPALIGCYTIIMVTCTPIECRLVWILCNYT